ncbi:putative CDC45 family protein [Helianthus annuus]|uniref:CDC45 family protein n=1 Tax=Helianthus annuus TaxID=4232 RepID=A0A251SH73_HELAN|nr:cell division control protein 45 homolog [Helianthus annuus]KAF5768835.1 putative CDC45 family protein [Helianthus annuus]KAJ0463994.1 putative CDC45 family protein [Helianthus annuus]KAJ0468350.1 putative CDC45 family protein [Helianthus annuus]
MVREQSIESFYSNLRESALGSANNTPLLIFPSTSDVDSLCALKIICHVLESDSARYACYPVSSFKEIHKYAGPSLSSLSDDPVTILLINWGCHRDLRKVLDLGPVARVFVVDSHRPIHLHNLSEGNDRVVVLYTRDDENQADLSYDFDVSALAAASDLNSDDEVEDDESDSDDESECDGDGDRKRRRVSDDEDDETDPLKLFRKLKKAYYHMGTFHGKPSGCLMYELSNFLRKNTNDLLWLACVALTDQFVHERLTNERYQAGVMELEQHINSSGNLGAVSSVTLKDGTIVCAPDASRIAYEDEPRLMLLQEWNLFDSMLCSSYIATKLKTWSDNGTKKLMLLLAQMGFALDECKQKFRFMSVEIKKKMKDEFEHFLPDYGLNNFYYRGFLLLHGYSSKISAADVVYGITALLESSVDSNSCASKQFGEAYDALSLRKLEKLEMGMRHAIKIQRAILRQGSTAITRKGSIRSGTKFRWVKLEDSADAKLLGCPQALTKLGYFIMDALREKGARLKPLVCVCYIQEREKVLIVGVCGKPRLGAVQGNAFGIAFRNAAEETGAEFFHELFESSWIVLEAVAVNDFMIKLTEKLI